VEDVQLKWSVSGAQKMREKMEIADYELIEIRTAKKEVHFPAGVWHDLEMIFEFKRRYGWCEHGMGLENTIYFRHTF